MDKQSHGYEFKEHENDAGSEATDVEQTLKMVASGFVGTHDSMADVSFNSRCIYRCIDI